MTIEVFSLEAMNAQHGDALLLHFGSKKAPKHILIDGGPVGVYSATIKPRLQQLAKARKVTPLPIAHTFVTHLDSDHIRGIVDFVNDIRSGGAPADCNSFWFNTFEDALTSLPESARRARTRAPAALTASADAVVASVAEGQTLRDTVRRLHARVNGGSGALLVAKGPGVPLDVSPDLKVTLVCPNVGALDKLAKDWKKKAKPTETETAAYVDQSVYNLSSLVFVVEAKGPAGKSARMLLTGDARGDHVIAGLDAGGFLKGGKAHFDILKVPHHGSDRDFTAEFFTAITATNYVISANGRYANPSEDVLDWIAAGAKKPYTLWLTNEGKTGYDDLEKNIKKAQGKQPSLKQNTHYREAAALSVIVDLFNPLGI